MKRHSGEKGAGGCLTRRNFIATAGMVAAGGVLAGGAMADLGAAKQAPSVAAPPLPWPWVKIDPLEAGRKAFQIYHEKGG